MQIDVTRGGAPPQTRVRPARAISANVADLSAAAHAVSHRLLCGIGSRQCDHAVATAGPQQRPTRIPHEILVAVSNLLVAAARERHALLPRAEAQLYSTKLVSGA